MGSHDENRRAGVVAASYSPGEWGRLGAALLSGRFVRRAGFAADVESRRFFREAPRHRVHLARRGWSTLLEGTDTLDLLEIDIEGAEAEVFGNEAETDRKGEIATGIDPVGIPPSPGYVGPFPAIGSAGPQRFPSTGALWCRLPRQVEIPRRAYREEVANVLVLEDDMARAKRFRSVEGSLTGQFFQARGGFVDVGHGSCPEKIPARHRGGEARTSGPLVHYGNDLCSPGRTPTKSAPRSSIARSHSSRFSSSRRGGPLLSEFESDPGGWIARTWTDFAGKVSRALRQNDAAPIRHPLLAHGARSLPCMSH